METLIKELLLKKVSAALMDEISDEQLHELVQSSVAESLKGIVWRWDVKDMIQPRVKAAVVEYLSLPETQAKHKAEAIRQVDELFDGIIREILISIQNGIKSDYQKFLKESEKREDKYIYRPP